MIRHNRRGRLEPEIHRFGTGTNELGALLDGGIMLFIIPAILMVFEHTRAPR